MSSNDAAPKSRTWGPVISGRGTASLTSTVTDDADGGQGCDFCNLPGAQWRYPCRSFARTVNGNDRIHVAMLGDWYACSTCHQMVSRNEWGRLRHRTLKRYERAFGTNSATVTAAMTDQLNVIWLAFRAHRTGAAVRIGGGSSE
ncbi:hypothetical protein [Streptomyces sp. MZ04]|uniref:hypothetical protein n=1 Tax=Streptomyces sp. MZ04 TaxID=2559236 RepID=UPI00107EA378|nr:hypothetical protein [Streptomyces sp. MZ04]TGA89423.1 hypothetical protein E2651_39375 [Streptomyces sp. MZ04]